MAPPPQRPQFSDSTIAGLADAVVERIPSSSSDDVTRTEFDALRDEVTALRVGHGKGQVEAATLNERINGVKASTAANERRMAEALAQVARAVRDVDRRSLEGQKSLSESIGVVKASASKAHQRMDKYRDRFAGAAAVVGFLWFAAVWVFEHWASLRQ